MGAIAISNVPHHSRTNALQQIIDESLADTAATAARVSWGGVISRGAKSQLVDKFGDEVNSVHVDPLRDAVNNVGSKLGQSLDVAFETSGWTDVTEKGEGLEHFHAYNSKPSDTVMDLHTDAGVFIVMTQGFVPGQERDSHELYLQLAKEQLVKAVTNSPDDIIVLVGEGGERKP